LERKGRSCNLEFVRRQQVGKSQSLRLSGLPLQKAKRINVNLLTERENVALQISFRFDENCIVRNSQFDQAWQNEEREGKFCLAKDTLFDVEVDNKPYAFQVRINGDHFCAYAHRTDPKELTKVCVDGDLELLFLELK
uniref:Galectin n=1 Tax=Soboliphyme baturini TaxID=241478 RepID=A0A183J0P4_9BILA